MWPTTPSPVWPTARASPWLSLIHIFPLLSKTRDTPPQSGLEEAGQRRAHVLGVYRAPDAAACLRVLLADDVVTTGSTLSEGARTLLTAGAAEVVCVTLAQARKDRPEKPRKTAK